MGKNLRDVVIGMITRIPEKPQRDK
jgi:hypothetical protein